MDSQSLLTHAYGIVLAPLAAFFVLIFFGRKLGTVGAWLGAAAMAYGLVHSVLIAAGIFQGTMPLPSEGLQGHFYQANWTWFSVGNFDFSLGLLIDGLSANMLVVVTLVAFLVQVYSIAYMHDHVRFSRYFAYVNLFAFSMLLLVVSNNLMQIFVGWEGVGVCSFLLISFDFERESAATAGRKAFLTTKLADLGFYAGLIMMFTYFGTFNIPSLQQNLLSVQHSTWILAAVPLCLFVGAMGKSAQVPFHLWLPDAMEGPTPASALIHAATMVAAGVYLVARVFFLFEAVPITLDVVAWVGVITAVFAASMGLVNVDIKRVLAFSTVSQLGFMMAALGCGGYAAGMFHLTTHAAFKALLFLCAGSVIHAVHTNDMRKMGGLMKKMPITAVTYLIATLAISGFPGFAGFFSKEEVLGAAYHHNPAIFWLLAFASLMTSFYMFRTWFLTFTGEPRDIEKFHHAHESPALMSIPLVVLAVPSIFLGAFFWYNGNLDKFLHWGEHAEEVGHSLVLIVSLTVFSIGLIASWALFGSKSKGLDKVRAAFGYPHFLTRLYGNLDEALMSTFAVFGESLAWIGNMLDGKFIDRVLVDGNSTVANKLGSLVRRAQSGLVQSYLFWMAIGLGLMFVWTAQKFN